MATRKKVPIDPVSGIPMILEGRIVTMNATDTVLPRGRLYVKDSSIVAVLPADAPRPAGFTSVPVTVTNGTLYPGLIELHNHLAYNALRLWDVPRKYSNRDQWGGIAEYREKVSGPMSIIGRTPELLPALIRYVEMKCLVAGVTTSQGVALFSNAGVRRYYRGIVRNVEATDEAALPEAETRIADVDARSAAAFLERLKKESCFLLHLAEGVDATARKHFQALQISGSNWAILPQLVGIHACALTPADFALFGARGGAIVWSPLSNLLLYGQTTDIAAARAAGVRIGLGSDWSPSGSKNLLGELKAANAVAALHGAASPRDLVAMATRNAAQMLSWDAVLGSLEPGKRADVTVIDGANGDPHGALIDASESDVVLVIINGVPRYGTKALFDALGASGEAMSVGGSARRAYLAQDTQDPAVGKLSYAAARDQLADALARLPALARALESPSRAARARPAPPWRLALDEIEPQGLQVRARLPLAHQHGVRTGPRKLRGAGAKPLSQIVKPLVLDALTAVDDADFVTRLGAQRNLPPTIREALVRSYG